MNLTEKRTLQFIDLKAQQARIREGLEARIKRVLDHGRYIMGPEVQEAEERLAAWAGVKHCISCASGTDALLMTLLAAGVGPGDAVFTSPFTFIATAEVISLIGARAVFVDIDPQTYNLDPAALESAVERYSAPESDFTPKGIIPVDLFGQPADYDEIEAIAGKYGLAVWEDAAQSFGAYYKGRKAGSLGEMSCTSFFPAKPLGCYGDGGAVLTDSDQLAGILRSIRVHGKGSHKYDNVRIGINGRFDTLQAAVILEKLGIFEEEITLRQQVAARYNGMLREHFITPLVREDRSSVWAQYSLQTDAREALLAKLPAAGIPTAIYYPKPLHLQEAFAGLGYRKGDFPVSERVAERVFSIPMHPYLSEEDQDYIVEALIRGIKG